MGGRRALRKPLQLARQVVTADHTRVGAGKEEEEAIGDEWGEGGQALEEEEGMVSKSHQVPACTVSEGRCCLLRRRLWKETALEIQASQTEVRSIWEFVPWWGYSFLFPEGLTEDFCCR